MDKFYLTKKFIYLNLISGGYVCVAGYSILK